VRSLSRLLGVPPEKLRPVLRLGLVYGAVGGAVAVGDATVQGLFVARVGADRLPEVLFARAVVSPALAFAYARLARPRSPRRVLAFLLGLAAVGAVAGRSLSDLGDTGVLSAYVLHEVLASLVTVHWGVYLLHNLRGDDALRGTPTIYAAARLGAAVAGVGLVPLVAQAGASVGFYAAASCFAAAALAAFFGHRAGPATGAPADSADSADIEGSSGAESDEEEAPRPSSFPGERSRGLHLVLASPLVGALAVATAVMVFVRFALRYQQQALLEGVDEQDLVTLLALYTAAANTVGVGIQLGLLGRFLNRFGLATTNLFYAGAVFIAQAALILVPGVPAALGARFADSELKHAIKTPLSSLFYQAFAPADRGPARAFVLGVVSPAAQILGAVGLAGAIAGANLATVAYVGLGATALFALATVALNRSYESTKRRDRLRP